MFDKLKNTFTKTNEDDCEQGKRRLDVSMLNGEEIKNYQKNLQEFQENVETIHQIIRDNQEQFLQYIKDRGEKVENNKKEGHQTQEQFTFDEDIEEIKQTLKDIQSNLQLVLTTHMTVKTKVHQIQEQQSSVNVKHLEDTIKKNQAQLNLFKKNQGNNKQILITLGQQKEVYIKQIKELQEKKIFMQKQLNQKNNLINNLRQEKNVLLEMRNSDTSAQIPQVEAMKNQVVEFQKRLSLEKIRVEQKQKEIEGLKKKMEEDRQSLQKIADELKQKQLKSKKIIDKYERSKTQIRKYREQKTEFIKQLNIQVAKMAEQLAAKKKQNEDLGKKVKQFEIQIQNLKNQVGKNQNRKIQLQSSQAELLQVRKQLHQRNVLLEEQKTEYSSLKQVNHQLQQKRKQLLEALEKPVNHEIRTLQKVLKALEKLYKEYIITVFQERNYVGFENKITYIISNVQEIKQDLLL